MKRKPFLSVVLLLALAALLPRGVAAAQTQAPLYEDVTATHLPTEALEGFSMDAQAADFDADGDLDVLVANEYEPNLLLINDGDGRFADESAARLPQEDHDSEDVAVADFDLDGDLDAVVVSEDDQTNELYLNDGAGHFTDGKARLPTEGTSNAVLAADADGDDDADLLLGNNGQNVLLENDGAGRFSDVTGTHLPTREDVTQDLELGDADGDGRADLLVANEGDNRLLLGRPGGAFAEAPEGALH